MRAAAHDFAHLLRDDSSHRVDRLENRADPLREIRDRDPVSGAKQNDHGFADDAAKTKQDGGHNSRERRGHDDARDSLESVRA